ncbi:MAG TPA: DUF1501 domain-containing protein [Phycisphaerales bacterium]|nr:DUF1501 domain-containing protein [Phycisphaerales bacterium]
MNSPLENPFSRRAFLQRGLTFVSLAATAPLFLQRSAYGLVHPLSGLLASFPGVPDDRILVVVQLAGGNDGLNTIIPYGDDHYYKARPNIAIPAPGRTANNGQQSALKLDHSAGVGLHPSLTGLKELIDEGVAAVVQGVGYPNPNRSHFTSTDIWHTADTSAHGNGWLGRYFDCTCKGSPDPLASIAIGRSAPLTLNGDLNKPVTFESADLFRWTGDGLDDSGSAKSIYDSINRTGELGKVDSHSQQAFLMRTALDAQLSSDRIRAAVNKTPLVNYPGSDLARQLQTVAAMIRDNLPTRVYYVSISGFDTHAAQVGLQANLLRQLGDALLAFHKDLKAQQNSGRVLTMTFSEFGRRVAQNASNGTDHGTAAPMYLMGDNLRPGILGNHPSLTDLDEGDLKFSVDFRSVYASVLQDWLGAPATKILAHDYRKANLFKV